MMLVGPSSGGKTALLETLLGLPGVFSADCIDSKAAFLSGTAAKDKCKNATGGLLRLVEPHGALVMQDFTEILDLPRDTIKGILDVLRQAYNGSWHRPIGAEGGKQLSWHGKLALFAGCTPAIDQYHSVSASLGERWIYYRLTKEDGEGFEKARRALQNINKAGWRDELRHFVRMMFESLDLRFGQVAPAPRVLTSKEMVRIIRIASVATRCRSAIVRDPYSKDVIGTNEPEDESRLSTILGQLLLGMELVGTPAPERWRLLGKVALDSMPQLRRVIVERVRESGEIGLGELRESVGCSMAVMSRTVEELALLGVLIRTKNELGHWRADLSEWMREELRKGWKT